MKKQKLPTMALVIFAVFMVSYSGPMIKGALGAGANPASIAFLRMLSATVLLAPLEIRSAREKGLALRLSKREGALILLAAAFLAGHYLTWITSLTGTSTFASVALVCTQPLFVALFSYLLFREKMPARAVPGAVLALVGALTIALAGLGEGGETADAGGALLSNLLALAGAVLMAGNWITGRETRRTLCAEIYTPLLYAATALLLALTLPAAGGFVMPAAALPWMAGLVIGSTLLGNAVLNYTLDKVSATIISFALLGEPVGAMIFSIFLFGETPAPLVALGGALTLAGLAYYLARSAPARK